MALAVVHYDIQILKTVTQAEHVGSDSQGKNCM